jgi:hypothetical protein
MSGFSGFRVISTNFQTAGATTITEGNAKVNAKTHAFSQMYKMSSTKPTLKILIMSDMKDDIKRAMKKPNTIC